MVHVHGFAEALHDLDADDVRVEQIAPAGSLLGSDCEQRRKNHRAGMRIGRAVEVVVVVGVRRGAVDERRKRRGEPQILADDRRAARAPGLHRAQCIRGHRLAAAGVYAGERIDQRGARCIVCRLRQLARGIGHQGCKSFDRRHRARSPTASGIHGLPHPVDEAVGNRVGAALVSHRDAVPGAAQRIGQ